MLPDRGEPGRNSIHGLPARARLVDFPLATTDRDAGPAPVRRGGLLSGDRRHRARRRRELAAGHRRTPEVSSPPLRRARGRGAGWPRGAGTHRGRPAVGGCARHPDRELRRHPRFAGPARARHPAALLDSFSPDRRLRQSERRRPRHLHDRGACPGLPDQWRAAQARLRGTGDRYRGNPGDGQQNGVPRGRRDIGPVRVAQSARQEEDRFSLVLDRGTDRPGRRCDPVHPVDIVAFYRERARCGRTVLRAAIGRSFKRGRRLRRPAGGEGRPGRRRGLELESPPARSGLGGRDGGWPGGTRNRAVPGGGVERAHSAGARAAGRSGFVAPRPQSAHRPHSSRIGKPDPSEKLGIELQLLDRGHSAGAGKALEPREAVAAGQPPDRSRSAATGEARQPLSRAPRRQRSGPPHPARAVRAGSRHPPRAVLPAVASDESRAARRLHPAAGDEGRARRPGEARLECGHLHRPVARRHPGRSGRPREGALSVGARTDGAHSAGVRAAARPGVIAPCPQPAHRSRSARAGAARESARAETGWERAHRPHPARTVRSARSRPPRRAVLPAFASNESRAARRLHPAAGDEGRARRPGDAQLGCGRPHRPVARRHPGRSGRPREGALSVEARIDGTHSAGARAAARPGVIAPCPQPAHRSRSAGARAATRPGVVAP